MSAEDTLSSPKAAALLPAATPLNLASSPARSRTSGRSTASPLVTTKLGRPPTPADLVGAPRIAQWAGEVSQRLLTVIRAPCGFGKTTAAAVLAEQFAQSHRVGWISFDFSDNDPDLGPSYILEALLSMGLDELAANDEDLVNASLSGNAIPLARAAINALANRPDEYFLFLDDFDRLTGDDCANFVNYLLINAPANLHLVITCQARPRLPLSYLRLRDALVEKSTNALRLQASDTRKLLNEGNLRKDQISKLHAAMEGWVTGVKLGAIGLVNNGASLDDIGMVVQGARWLSEYIEDNIFDHMPSDVRTLLLKCSISERFSAPLAAHLSGHDAAPQMVQWLSEQNAFVEALDFTGEWYRLHPVFREFLLKRLREEGLDQELHRSAARFFAAHDQPTDAVRHAIAGGDTELALDCLEGVAMGFVESSNLPPLLEWIALLPPQAVKTRLGLSVARAWALALTGRPEMVEVIADIERYATEHPATDSEALRADLAGMRSLHAALVADDWEAAGELAMTYLRQGSEQSSFGGRNVRNTAALCSTLAGDVERARELLIPPQAPGAQVDQTLTSAGRQWVLALGCYQQGHFAEAQRVARAALKKCEAPGGGSEGSAALLASVAAACAYERNLLREASTILHGRLARLDDIGFQDASIMGYRVEVGIHLLERDANGAVELVEHAESLGQERGWDRLRAVCASFRARMGLPQMIDMQAIERRIDWLALHAHPLSRTARIARAGAEALIIDKFERDDLSGAQRVIEHCLVLTKASPLEQIKIRLLQADLLRRMDRALEADSAVARVIRSAAPIGALRCILDSTSVGILDGFDGTAAFHRLTECEKAHYAALVAARSQGSQGARRDITPKALNLFDLMTKREIDILLELSTGLSNKEIARQVSMTPETVKWHVGNILRKLDADTRREAVSKAIGMGLSVVL